MVCPEVCRKWSARASKFHRPEVCRNFEQPILCVYAYGDGGNFSRPFWVLADHSGRILLVEFCRHLGQTLRCQKIKTSFIFLESLYRKEKTRLAKITTTLFQFLSLFDQCHVLLMLIPEYLPEQTRWRLSGHCEESQYFV